MSREDDLLAQVKRWLYREFPQSFETTSSESFTSSLLTLCRGAPWTHLWMYLMKTTRSKELKALIARITSDKPASKGQSQKREYFAQEVAFKEQRLVYLNNLKTLVKEKERALEILQREVEASNETVLHLEASIYSIQQNIQDSLDKKAVVQELNTTIQDDVLGCPYTSTLLNNFDERSSPISSKELQGYFETTLMILLREIKDSIYDGLDKSSLAMVPSLKLHRHNASIEQKIKNIFENYSYKEIIESMYTLIKFHNESFSEYFNSQAFQVEMKKVLNDSLSAYQNLTEKINNCKKELVLYITSNPHLFNQVSSREEAYLDLTLLPNEAKITNKISVCFVRDELLLPNLIESIQKRELEFREKISALAHEFQSEPSRLNLEPASDSPRELYTQNEKDLLQNTFEELEFCILETAFESLYKDMLFNIQSNVSCESHNNNQYNGSLALSSQSNHPLGPNSQSLDLPALNRQLKESLDVLSEEQSQWSASQVSALEKALSQASLAQGVIEQTQALAHVQNIISAIGKLQ